MLTPAKCAKENKDGFNYGCKSFDFSKGFNPQQGPGALSKTALFEGIFVVHCLAILRANKNGGKSVAGKRFCLCVTSRYARADHCDASPLFEKLPCSFKTELGQGNNCSNFCDNQVDGTKCVRSWLQKNVADFGKNNCDKTYLQDEDAVCVCANVGTCTLYADAPNKPECNDEVEASETSTHFRMDKRM